MNIQKQKERLQEELASLEQDLNNLGRRDERGGFMVVPDEGDGSFADPIDNADITEDFEEKVARLQILERQYTQVKKALLAIENGTYGICEVSGEKIQKERLMANPSATTTTKHAR